MENDWYSLDDTARHINVSVRALQRHIKAGKYTAKFTGVGSRVVCLRNIDATIDDADAIDDVSSTIGLQEQLRYVCRQNDMLTRHLAESNQLTGLTGRFP
jgi:AraC-like DNA-binding protein